MSKNFTEVDLSSLFIFWLKKLGPKKVMEAVGVKQATYYNWLSLKSAPYPKEAMKIVEITLGFITLEDIYSPFTEENS